MGDTEAAGNSERDQGGSEERIGNPSVADLDAVCEERRIKERGFNLSFSKCLVCGVQSNEAIWPCVHLKAFRGDLNAKQRND